MAHAHPHDRDYDYTAPYRTSSRLRRDLDGDRDRDPLPHLDAGLDRVGDYVARRLVPVMLNRSDRPLQLVMNFGTLHLSDDGHGRRGSGGVGVASGSSNAVVYNAPGCVMTMGSGAALGGGSGEPRSLLGDVGGQGRGTYGYGAGAAHGRRVGLCDGCGKRQLVAANGYCFECDLGARESGFGLEGVRYGRTPDWLRREERDVEMEGLRDLERERKLRRERERRHSGLGGYTTDYERDNLRYATDRDGFRYAGERW